MLFHTARATWAPVFPWRKCNSLFTRVCQTANRPNPAPKRIFVTQNAPLCSSFRIPTDVLVLELRSTVRTVDRCFPFGPDWSRRVAIDRFTGEVIDQQLEAVYE